MTRFLWDGDALLGDVEVEKTECIRQRERVYYPESFEPLAMAQEEELYFGNRYRKSLTYTVKYDVVSYSRWEFSNGIFKRRRECL